MHSPTAQLGLSRRAAACFLLFCLLAITLLAGGFVYSVKSMLGALASDGALSRLARLSAAIELDHVGTNGARAQKMLARARAEARCEYAAVVGVDGRYQAHTDPALVGEQALEPVGEPLHWGAIEGVRFRDPRGDHVCEYSTRLDADAENVGQLRMAIVEPTLADVASLLSRFAWWALLAPIACAAVGCYLLVRLMRPVAEIESRLTTLALDAANESTAVEPATPRGLASVGWNRLCERFSELRSAEAAADPEWKLATRSGGEDRLTREALESLAEGVAVTDAEGRVEFANRAVAALLGLDGELEGGAFLATLEAISPPGAERFHSTGYATVAVAEAPIDGEDDEHDRTLRVERSPLRGDQGDASGHVWTVRDVTQQKLVEASRDRFIDTATHELRTPLTNIKAYAETLASGDFQDVEQQKEFCNTINTEATRLARFVDDLLSISSLETGSLSVIRQSVNVRRLADEAAEKVRPLMKTRSIDFQVKFSEKLGEAALDKDKVSGLLVNLLGNAAKYSPEGSSVTFTAVRKDDELQFEVRDTGYGIAEEEQQRVFEKFFRSENPEVRDEVGTGLGLPLAREIARLHRGDLTLESELGEGSTFTVTLPIK